MNAILIIASHEIRRQFISPLTWIALATAQFLLAVFFYLLLSRYLESGAVFAERGLTAIVCIGLMQIAGTLGLLLSPFITMRSFSDELRSGTIKLLLSAPVSSTALVLGKYLGLMAYYLCLLLIITLMPMSLAIGTSLDPGLMLSGLLALALLFSCFAAVGLFISSLSNSPALAALNSFVLLAALWIVHIASDPGSPVLASAANYLSLQKHFNMLLSGAINSADIVYFLLLTLLCIALCIWRLDTLRTHR